MNSIFKTVLAFLGRLTSPLKSSDAVGKAVIQITAGVDDKTEKFALFIKIIMIVVLMVLESSAFWIIAVIYVVTKIVVMEDVISLLREILPHIDRHSNNGNGPTF